MIQFKNSILSVNFQINDHRCGCFINLALPLSDFGVGQHQLVLGLRTCSRLLVQGGADRVKLQLHLVKLRLQLRAFLNIHCCYFDTVDGLTRSASSKRRRASSSCWASWYLTWLKLSICTFWSWTSFNNSLFSFWRRWRCWAKSLTCLWGPPPCSTNRYTAIRNARRPSLHCAWKKLISYIRDWINFYAHPFHNWGFNERDILSNHFKIPCTLVMHWCLIWFQFRSTVFPFTQCHHLIKMNVEVGEDQMLSDMR